MHSVSLIKNFNSFQICRVQLGAGSTMSKRLHEKNNLWQQILIQTAEDKQYAHAIQNCKPSTTTSQYMDTVIFMHHI